VRTPQLTLQRPATIYGITKVAGELLCDYHADRFGVDTRGLRLPGLISHTGPPGGGTTAYAVEMFRQNEIRKHMLRFLIDDAVDPLRQAITGSWPRALDDSAARTDRDWLPQFALATMTKCNLALAAARPD
jgi:nucleoside-diphosphate-sugar epimerase